GAFALPGLMTRRTPVKRVIAILLGSAFAAGAGGSYRGEHLAGTQQQDTAGSGAEAGSSYPMPDAGPGSGSGSGYTTAGATDAGVPSTPDPNCTATEDQARQFATQAAPFIAQIAAGDLDVLTANQQAAQLASNISGGSASAICGLMDLFLTSSSLRINAE